MSSSIECRSCGHAGMPIATTKRPDRYHGVPGDFALSRCSACKSVQVDNPPENLAQYYPSNYYSYAPNGTHRPTSWDAEILQTRPAGKVLDVGGGNGAAMALYKRAGWDTTVLDVDDSALDLAHEAGHEIVRQSAGPNDLTLPIAKVYDFVRARHVIEHVLYPKKVFDSLSRILAPGGLFVIELPNLEGRLAEHYGWDYWQLDPPRHLTIPHPTQLLKWATAADLVVHTQTVGHGMGIAHSARLRHQTNYTLEVGNNSLANKLAARALQPLARRHERLGIGDSLILKGLRQ